jgi:hypothetical protein
MRAIITAKMFELFSELRVSVGAGFYTKSSQETLYVSVYIKYSAYVNLLDCTEEIEATTLRSSNCIYYLLNVIYILRNYKYNFEGLVLLE